MLRVILSYLVPLQYGIHIIMHCYTNLLTEVSHSTPMLCQEGGDMNSHTVYLSGNTELLLKKNLEMHLIHINPHQ